MVSGCITPTVLSKNKKTITVRSVTLGAGSQSLVHTMAGKHCSSHGKDAVLTMKDRHVHTFECK